MGHDAAGEHERLSEESRAALLAAARESFQVFAQSLKSRFREAPAVYAAGRVCEMTGQPAAALEHFRRALEAPDVEAWPRLLTSMARCARAAGLETETAGWLAANAVRAPALAVLDIWAGQLFRAAGAYQRAVAVLERCVGQAPDLAVRFQALADWLDLLIGTGQHDEARELCRRGMSLFPAQAPSLGTALAGLLIGAGRTGEALGVIAEVLETAPAHAPAHLIRGAALLRQSRRDEARESLAEAGRLEPRLAERAAALLGEPP